MRKFPFVLAAGALALAGTAALAGGSDLHTMTVKLPDGGVAKIEYSGNVPPKVKISTGFPRGDFAAFAPGIAFSGLPDLAKIEAAMDRQMDDMLRKADAIMEMAARPNAPLQADFGALPGGESSWFVSSGKGGNFCAHFVEVTVVNGKKTVRSRTEGNCAASDGSTEKTAEPSKSI